MKIQCVSSLPFGQLEILCLNLSISLAVYGLCADDFRLHVHFLSNAVRTFER